MVRREGLEPSSLSAQSPQDCAYTNSAISARCPAKLDLTKLSLVQMRGLEPPTLSGQRSERCAYTNSATPARSATRLTPLLFYH